MLEDWQECLDVAHLFFHKQNKSILELYLAGLLVGGEVGADVALVVFHALNVLNLVLKRFAIAYSNRPLLSDLAEDLGNEFAYVLVPVGRVGCHLLHDGLVLGRHGH